MHFNETLKNIRVYEAGKPIEEVVKRFGIEKNQIIKLASNENPYGFSSLVKKKILENINLINRYPDDSMSSLKYGLSKRFGIKEQNIIIGAGSDQILEFIARAVLNNTSKVLMSKITFAMYEIYALQQGAKIYKSSAYKHDLEEFADICKKIKFDIVYICTPNNPTGDAIDSKELHEFLNVTKEPLIVVDAAYMEYAEWKDKKKKISPKELIENYENVIYLGTFSKAFGLGGMRIGYGIASEKIIQNLYKLRPPFNITTLSLIAAATALEDMEFVNSSVKKNFFQMKRFEDFAAKEEIKYIESYTNFILFLLRDKISSSKVFLDLFKKGIIVRDMKSYGLNGIRVTIGKKMENEKFFEKFEEVLNGY